MSNTININDVALTKDEKECMFTASLTVLSYDKDHIVRLDRGDGSDMPIIFKSEDGVALFEVKNEDIPILVKALQFMELEI